MTRPRQALELEARIETCLGSQVVRTRAASGGNINQTRVVLLADGRKLFVKTHPQSPAGMYLCEARGLAFLAEAKALRTPEVLLACDADDGGPACLVLEQVEIGRPNAAFDETLGCGLAKLHRSGAPSFGLDHDNYIAVLPQSNTPLPTWGEFYAERRVRAQTQLATQTGRIDATLCRRLHALCDRLPELTGPEEPPSRLHGDLWGGNLLCDERGEPCLIDPAVYAGQREIDLAMMRLFGGFGERVFDAYAAAYPLSPGHRERVPLYQLYPLLVHVNLFGGQYVSQVAQLVRRWD